MLGPRHAFVHLAAGSILIAGALIWAASLAGCVSPAGSSTASSHEDAGRFEPFDNWYPADITPPAGTQYPCALTALPPELDGIPDQDHRYINHVYSQLLRATRAKLTLLRPDNGGSRRGRLYSRSRRGVKLRAS